MSTVGRSEVERLTDLVQAAIEAADYLDFGEPDTEDMAQRAVNAFFEFFGMEGELP
jgi:hypothetical protein